MPPKKTAPKEKYRDLFKVLNEYQKEIDIPRRREKTKNVLDRDKKEILEGAVLLLSDIVLNETGYDAKWVMHAIDKHWQAGTNKIVHDYWKRIRCCQLIYFLKSRKISETQAMLLVDQIYKFNKTDAKDNYYYFKRDIKKYYFPAFRIKSNIPIRIFLDMLKYGQIKMLHLPHMKKDTVPKFEKIIGDILELLKAEIKSAQRKKLNKQGLKINPVILKIINRDYKSPKDFILELKKDDSMTGEFIFYTRQFLDDLEQLESTNIQRSSF
jgi:hypothetical protein